MFSGKIWLVTSILLATAIALPTGTAAGLNANLNHSPFTAAATESGLPSPSEGADSEVDTELAGNTVVDPIAVPTASRTTCSSPTGTLCLTSVAVASVVCSIVPVYLGDRGQCTGAGTLQVQADTVLPLDGFVRMPGTSKCLNCASPTTINYYLFDSWDGLNSQHGEDDKTSNHGTKEVNNGCISNYKVTTSGNSEAVTQVGIRTIERVTDFIQDTEYGSICDYD